MLYPLPVIYHLTWKYKDYAPYKAAGVPTLHGYTPL